MEEESLDQKTTLVLIQATAVKATLQKVAQEPEFQCRERVPGMGMRPMSKNET
ncbi:hypothetical protein [Desulfomicrobium apsheronum]|uniref:hypothetical protein n=1 Tax=Desulfomicrobium apsheronum TaxID=52560 RepID=UPI0015A5F70E|nr:hypothetical protein [Desulfomicrobium apsheronum]